MTFSSGRHRAWKFSCFLIWCLIAETTAFSTTFTEQVRGERETSAFQRDHEGSRQPNIIFILADDQDQHMSSLNYMPYLQNHLVKEGTVYSRHYCTVSLGCPSRASLWTGKHAHNTNVTGASLPYSGYAKFVSRGLNDDYLPLWLQAAGYNTYYIGKLFDTHSLSNYNKPYLRGWNGSDFLLDPYNNEYLNATMQRNVEIWGQDAVHENPKNYQGQYVTDVIADKSMDLLDTAITQRYEIDGSGRPFFLTIAPPAPHCNTHMEADRDDASDTTFTKHQTEFSPAIPAKRHQHLFLEAVIPRTPDFNPDKDNTISWLKNLSKQNETDLHANDHFYRQRLRALQAVDEMIPRLLLKLEFAGILQETYIIYTSDNGYHIGQHRLQPGKQCAYETDVNVPMIVRGPDVLKGRVENKVSSHVDLASTFLSLAGMDPSISGPKYGLDGQSMVFHYFQPTSQAKDEVALEEQSETPLSTLNSGTLHAQDLDQRAEHALIEMWGKSISEGKYGQRVYHNNTYKALRVISATNTYNLLYIIWCTNERELYDLCQDPYAMDNLLVSRNITATSISISISTDDHDGAKQQKRYSLDKVLSRLNALMVVLKTCKQRQCTHPWDTLHTPGTVGTLSDALDQRHDELYLARIPQVEFDRCEEAYIPDAG